MIIYIKILNLEKIKYLLLFIIITFTVSELFNSIYNKNICKRRKITFHIYNFFII